VISESTVESIYRAIDEKVYLSRFGRVRVKGIKRGVDQNAAAAFFKHVEDVAQTNFVTSKTRGPGVIDFRQWSAE
jgi:hypothetical protein